MNDRKEQIEIYRKMSLRKLLEMRFYGEYVSGCIEDTIFERVEILESLSIKEEDI